MKVGRRSAVLLAVVLAVALSLIGSRSAPAAHASAKAAKLTIWVDNVQKPAVDKITSSWGTRRGVDVNVVFHSFGSIRDDLKTVKAENAPDVIVAAHDWTGDLAANGLVLSLFPTKALKAQFPKYALDAFSYGGRLYGAPYALENVGLVVNTRLVKVPKTFAQFEKEALAFKSKSPDNIALAVPQGSGGDAYHMYPFFSGLGGFVFGHAKNGALQPNKLGLASKTFLSNAGLIDKWNREGLINSKIDYGTAKNAFLKQQAAFWITGPWEVDALKASGFPFRIIQLPRIKYRSVPFLGVQGAMVTKFAQGHGVESLAKDLVASEMMKAGFQLDLEQANLRYPANKLAGKRVNDAILKQFGAAGVGGVPMPNIPQMGSVWAELGGAWVKATKGTGSTSARSAFSTAAKNILDKIAGGEEAEVGGRPSRWAPTTTVRLTIRQEEGLSTPSGEIEPRSRATAGTWALSLPIRLISAFSGTVGLVIKIVLLSVVNAFAIWAAVVLADHHKWRALVLLALVTAAIDVVYLTKRWSVPLKFLIPGTIFLLAFQVIPVAYTINVAFTNYSTGHILSRAEAISNIEQNSLTESANGASYSMTLMRDDKHQLVLALRDDSGRTFIGTPDGLRPIPRAQVTISDGTITTAQGYTPLKGTELGSIDTELTSYKVPVGGGKAIEPQGFDSAVVLEPTYRFDQQRNAFVRIKDGVLFRDNGRGAFVAATGDEIEPGWKTYVGMRNFGRIIHSPLIRSPFLKVFVWTMVFATSVVLLSFILGLLLAVTLNKPGLRFQRTYRALLIIPYAVPAFLALLVWQGLLNDDFGVVNRAFHTSIPWLFDPNWARLSVILVSVWLTVPYFFLVSLGALQSIPSELIEAAEVDGGGAWQVFRKITLPLLLVAVAPLMIASFAFNFNNFNNIYLLTGGGPALNNSPVAGATDILISYTYKIAFAAGKGQDYGLASAIAIFIFITVGTISAISFSRTRALENLA